MKRIIFFILVFYMGIFAQSLPSRLSGMGEIGISVSDPDRQLNLYQYAGNIAWLKANDSLNWGRYGSENINEWGGIKRNWDADAVHLAQLVFSGQKHISESQIFYGRVSYNRDFYRDIAYAIEPEPYAADPFVLTDYTIGDFTWFGPKAFLAFSQRIYSDIYLGIALDYGIQQGLKAQNTMPEIVSRRIAGSLDLAWKISDALAVGFSYKPFNQQDLTNFENLPDGSSVFIRRYKGEIKYAYHVGASDRTARYKGHQEQLQLTYKNGLYEAALFGGYAYLWHEVFDGSTSRTYEGYYQDEAYFLNSVVRRHFNTTTLTLGYNVRYSEDWAKEAVADFLIYEANYLTQQATIGVAHQFSVKPILLASELVYASSTPDRKDYLGHQFRKGENINFEWHTGIEMNTNQPWRFRAGYIFTKYSEHKIWNYFGNYKGPGFTFGFGYYGSKYRVEGACKYQRAKRTGMDEWDSRIMRENMDAYLSVKQYF